MFCRNQLKVFKVLLGLALGAWLGVSAVTAIAVEFRPPRRSIPARREGAGTRGPACVQGEPNLTVLLPPTNLGLTTADYPQFFWFVPQTRAKSMKFSLFQGDDQDPTQQLIYEQTLDTPTAPGVVRFALPKAESAAPLQVDRDYFWTVTLVCQPDDPSRNISAEGWIQRVAIEPDLAKALATAKASDRPQIYAENGYWFETLASLANLRCENAGNAALTKSWVKLLTSVKLGRLANQPLHQVCPSK
jgi:hypothetical protein